MIKDIKKIHYTFRHRQAMMFLLEKYKDKFESDVYIQLKERLKYHDVDKMFLCLFWRRSKVSRWHYYHADHHTWKQRKYPCDIDIWESILDDESAYLTKPDKTLNAFDTFTRYTPELCSHVVPKLHELGWDYSYDVLDRDSEFVDILGKMTPKEMHMKIYDEIDEYMKYQLTSDDVLNHKATTLFYVARNGMVCTIGGEGVCYKWEDILGELLK